MLKKQKVKEDFHIWNVWYYKGKKGDGGWVYYKGRGFFKKREREFFHNFSSIFSLFLEKKKKKILDTTT